MASVAGSGTLTSRRPSTTCSIASSRACKASVRAQAPPEGGARDAPTSSSIAKVTAAIDKIESASDAAHQPEVAALRQEMQLLGFVR